MAMSFPLHLFNSFAFKSDYLSFSLEKVPPLPLSAHPSMSLPKQSSRSPNLSVSCVFSWHIWVIRSDVQAAAITAIISQLMQSGLWRLGLAVPVVAGQGAGWLPITVCPSQPLSVKSASDPRLSLSARSRPVCPWVDARAPDHCDPRLLGAKGTHSNKTDTFGRRVHIITMTMTWQ